MPKIKTYNVPTPEWSGLLQAIFWIAFDESPVEPGYEFLVHGHEIDIKERLAFEPDKIAEAKKALLFVLKREKLIAHGRLGKKPDHPQYSWYCRKYREHEMGFTRVPAKLWSPCGLKLKQETLKYDGGEFVEVRFKTVELYRAFDENYETPVANDVAQSAAPAYETPYMMLMRMAIQEFGISNDNQVKKEMLLNWLMQQKIGDRHLTRNIADSMATLVRLPESQRGGNKKWIKAAK